MPPCTPRFVSACVRLGCACSWCAAVCVLMLLLHGVADICTWCCCSTSGTGVHKQLGLHEPECVQMAADGALCVLKAGVRVRGQQVMSLHGSEVCRCGSTSTGVAAQQVWQHQMACVRCNMAVTPDRGCGWCGVPWVLTSSWPCLHCWRTDPGSPSISS
jgi:hypothetical protein